jgi:hypothetical protein
MSRTYDVAVVYRIYPGVSKTPALFPRDKYRLAALCVKSFRASLGGLKAKVRVLLDNCPPEYEELFKGCFDPEDLELIRLEGAGNAATFLKQVEILLRQEDSEIVYFAEDDYFYLPGDFIRLVEFIRDGGDVDFVSPHDHPAYYFHNVSDHPNRMRTFNGRHWRSAGTACLTFLTTKTVLRRTERVFRSYARRNSDSSLWLSLTKYKVLDPVAIVRALLGDRETFKIIAKAWYFCWRQILFGRRWNLWVPLPAVATHMEKGDLSPGIDWEARMRSTGDAGDAPMDTQ